MFCILCYRYFRDVLEYINNINRKPIPDLFVVLTKTKDTPDLKAIANENSICSQNKKAIVMIDFNKRKKFKTNLV